MRTAIEITDAEVMMLRECFDVEHETGRLIWKKKVASKVVVGREAGGTRQLGYRAIQLNGRRYLTHRAIFAIVNGWCPAEVDHINGDPSDNRPSNLRPATRSQQNYNSRPRKVNRLGLKGVVYFPKQGLYHARIRVDGKCISLKYHKTAEAAHEAYKAAAAKYHGEYRRLT